MRHHSPAPSSPGRMRNRLWAVCLSLLFVLPDAVSVSLSGASTPPPPPQTEAEPGVAFDRHSMLEHLAKRVMLPTYTAFAAATQDLHEAATQFCEAPTEDQLVATQVAWKRAVVLWKHSEAYHLGPTMGFAMAIDFWPTRPRIIQSVLRSSQPLAAETIAFAGAAANRSSIRRSISPNSPEGWLRNPGSCPCKTRHPLACSLHVMSRVDDVNERCMALADSAVPREENREADPWYRASLHSLKEE